MGSDICYQDRSNQQNSNLDLNLPTSQNSQFAANLLNYRADMPRSQYAMRVIKMPDLSIPVSQKLQSIQEKGKGRENNNQSTTNRASTNTPLHEQGIDFPPFYLRERKAYYSGQWKDGYPNGKGVIIFADSSYYVGTFLHGQAQTTPSNPTALFIFPDGSTYKGQVFQSRFNGKGVFQSVVGVVYDGEWKDGKPDGVGNEMYPDGASYYGDFVQGVKQGRGKFKWSDGREYEGQFQNGYMQGSGRIRVNGEIVFQGDFVQNKKQGEGTLTTPYGKYFGPFKDGQFCGEGKFNWKDGKQYIGSFKDGKMHGKGVIKLPTGQTIAGQWHRGQNIRID